MQRSVGAFNLEDNEEGGEGEGAAGEGVGDDNEAEPVLDDLGPPEVEPARVNYPLFRREVTWGDRASGAWWPSWSRSWNVVDMDVATAAAEEVDTGVVPVGTVLAVLMSSRLVAAFEEEDKQGEAEVDSEVVVVEVLSPGKGAWVRPSRGSVITASSMDISKQIVRTCSSWVTEWAWLPTGRVRRCRQRRLVEMISEWTSSMAVLLVRERLPG
uniref:Uncharacterized protein n=1 Tax=Chromera velia CCMP2878 TaxID=1169474 RepID=A0A0G4GHB7_9ALVE|eukprot:Cvel_4699.t1-p1 / transcript=Cvel_4699.t1 / gene=Cvel_4699 / organism=Chromera_velia_CCMP2878 / gene_product=hypothetical protein / transcript_product=hypothetical protein / location=Cvel_scaffold209:2523-7036(+) / protein_length=212 / sequence_SO=supercontig / SO=protein_coding / is_pseudo=false